MKLPRRSNANAGFTMVEIAIALGVIAFALVVIIGILPTGMQVQRDNRSETIINHDATFWLNAIKSGGHGMDELVNFVDRIDIRYDPDTPQETTTTHSGFRYGWEIIGLLTTPARTRAEVYASVWAMSGSAAEKEPNTADRTVSFKYRLEVNMELGRDSAEAFLDKFRPPATPLSYPLMTHHQIGLTLAYPLVNDNANQNLKDIRVTRRQSVRTAANRRVYAETNAGVIYTFFTPSPIP
jgi:hypothetical protein